MAKYIDRQALIDQCEEIIKQEWNKKAAPVSWSDAYESFVDDIEEIPAADVAPVKHGEWFVVEHSNHLNVTCSVCRARYYVYKKGQYHIEQSNFCPNCGAKMDGKETE